MVNATARVDEAFDWCESVTRMQARDFYYGIRLLSPNKHATLCAVYALVRRIDDIGDGDLLRNDKLAALSQVRRSLTDLGHSGGDPVLIADADVRRRLLPLGAFDELAGYCRRVAGAAERLCLAVFESRPDSRAPAYADALGIALQEIYILRDIREDLCNESIYLQRHDLEQFGVQLALDDHGDLLDVSGRLTALIRHSADRVRQWYKYGLPLVPLLDRRSAACCPAMSGIYLRLLDRVAAQPFWYSIGGCRRPVDRKRRWRCGPLQDYRCRDYRRQAHLVDQIVHCLGGFGPVHPRIAAGRRDIIFALPREVI